MNTNNLNDEKLIALIDEQQRDWPASDRAYHFLREIYERALITSWTQEMQQLQAELDANYFYKTLNQSQEERERQIVNKLSGFPNSSILQDLIRDSKQQIKLDRLTPVNSERRAQIRNADFNRRMAASRIGAQQ